jgi:hypothetical protein
MEVAGLWRYPVKSMAGEALEHADLGRLGVPGDRIVYAVDGRGEIVSARTRPRLLRHRADLGRDLEPRVDGLPWDAPATAEQVRRTAGEDARLVRASDSERFDVLPLLVATDGAIAALGEDGRRLRPNVVVAGVPGLAERAWEGRVLRIGGALVGLASLRRRCVITTWDPDTGAQDVEVLQRIGRDFGGTMALNAWVVEPGPVNVGDDVELLGRVSVEQASALPLGRFVQN